MRSGLVPVGFIGAPAPVLRVKKTKKRVPKDPFEDTFLCQEETSKKKSERRHLVVRTWRGVHPVSAKPHRT